MQLFDLGYNELVLVARNDKKAISFGWTSDFPDQMTVQRHLKAGGNLGVVARHVPGFDLDLTDEVLSEEIAEFVQDRLGYAPIRFSHHPASKLLMYRTDEPFTRMHVDLGERGKVEVLCDGQQYVVHGGHPKGGKYRVDEWRPYADLDPVTREQVVDVLKELAEKYDGHLVGRGLERTAKPVEELLAPSIDELREAVESIPNEADSRHEYVTMAQAIHGASGGSPEGFDIFMEWRDRWDGVQQDNPQKLWASLHPESLGWEYVTDKLPGTVAAPMEFTAEPPPPSMGDDSWRSAPEYTELRAAYRVRPHLLRHHVKKGRGGVYSYDNGVWVWDENRDRLNNDIRERLRIMADEYLRRDASIPRAKSGARTPEGRECYGYYKRLTSAAGVKAVAQLVEGDLLRPGVQFEAQQDHILTPSGVLDLRNGTTRPVQPEDYFLFRTAYDPVPGPTPHFDAFLDYLTYGDQSLKDFLQTWVGYCLTGHTREKKLMYVYGQSNTGKSTAINLFASLFGDYAKGTDFDTFSGKKSNTDAIAQMDGRRLIVATEPANQTKWDGSLLKAITGGDPVEARRLYGSESVFYPRFTLMVSGNHPPELEGVDPAFMKRLLVFPADRPVARPDRDLPNKLLSEAPAIMAWAVEGAMTYYAQGLHPPQAITAATKAYEEEVDDMGLFVGECLTFDENGFETTQDLYNVWRSWAARTGLRNEYKLISFARELHTKLKDMGSTADRGRSGNDRGFMGLTIKAVERPGIREVV